MKFYAQINVMPLKALLDPQGKAVLNSAVKTGFETLRNVRIGKHIDVEIEAFVHGALCVSVSGQCLLSLSIGNRSANRGACAQPCRMKYSLANSNGIVENNSYILSKKDISRRLHISLSANFIIFPQLLQCK